MLSLEIRILWRSLAVEGLAKILIVVGVAVVVGVVVVVLPWPKVIWTERLLPAGIGGTQLWAHVKLRLKRDYFTITGIFRQGEHLKLQAGPSEILCL